MNQLKQKTPGIFLCLIAAVFAWLFGNVFPLVGGPIFGILFGMLILIIISSIQSKNQRRYAHDPQPPLFLFEGGIKFTSKVLLQCSIILLGFDMNLFHVARVGSQSLLIMLFTLSSAFIVAFYAGKRLGLDGKMVTLIGVGTSICGGSAIAATAPVIHAEDKDVAQSISTIFFFNVIAVFIFPALGHLFGMSDTGFGMWAGTAINDTSSVVAAGTAWSAVANNNTALAYATIVKLTRTLFIIPVTLTLAIYTARKSEQAVNHSTFKFMKIFPWFVIGFIIASMISTFSGIPATTSHTLVSVGKFMIIMAMVAIGLSTHPKKLIANGIKPLLLGLCCWFAVAFVSLLIQLLMNLW